MTSKLNPSQAFIHIVALWPNVNKIEKYTNNRVYLHYDMEGEQRKIQRYMPCIEWGSTKEYPIKEVWRDATVQDIVHPYKKAKFSDVAYGDLDSWHDNNRLNGFILGEDTGAPMWIDEEGDYWNFCKVLDDAQSSPDGQPIETFNLPPETDCLLFMGGEWLRGRKSRGPVPFLSRGHNRSMNWDRDNQPTRWKPLNNNDLVGATPMTNFDKNDTSSSYIFYMGGVWREGSMRSNGVVFTISQSCDWDRAHQPTYFKVRPKNYTENPINEDDC